MFYYTDNPALDAERYYQSLPRTIGTCPFCGEIVQQVGSRPFIFSLNGQAVAHKDCYEDATWGDIEEMDEEERDDLELWIKEFLR